MASLRKDPEVLSTDQLWQEAQELAREVLECSAEEAFGMLERGELDGKMIETELHMLWFLLGKPSFRPSEAAE